jgi:uncharacterized protein (DUF1499 family)
MTTRTLSKELHYHSPYPAIALGGFSLAVLSALVAVLAGVGSRWGWWYFGTGFMVLTGAMIIGFLSVIVDAVSTYFIRGDGARHILALALAGIVIGLSAAAVPAAWVLTSYRMPAIHDITTDRMNPPVFIAVMPLRQDAANPAEYEGREVAEQQLSAYPDVRPLILPLRPADAFQKARAVASKMGWTIIDANERDGRIEATATTFWFGFKDDIVVRIRPDGFGSRVDVRSVSRVGKGDMGTNARRIMAYLRALGMES